MFNVNCCLQPAFRNISQELVDYIIDHLYDDKSTLLMCGLVSRSFHIASRYHLFHTIRVDWSLKPSALLDNPSWFKTLSLILRLKDDDTGDLRERNDFADFLRVLKRYPSIGTWVRVLIVSPVYGHGWGELSANHLLDAFRILEGLQSCTLRILKVTYHDSQGDQLPLSSRIGTCPATIHKFKKLSIDRVDFGTYDVLDAFLSIFSEIQYLEVYSLFFDFSSFQTDIPRHTSKSLNVLGLTYLIPKPIVYIPILNILRTRLGSPNSLQSLDTLVIFSDYNDVEAVDLLGSVILDSKDSLKSLSLEVVCMRNVRRDPWLLLDDTDPLISPTDRSMRVQLWSALNLEHCRVLSAITLYYNILTKSHAWLSQVSWQATIDILTTLSSHPLTNQNLRSFTIWLRVSRFHIQVYSAVESLNWSLLDDVLATFPQLQSSKLFIDCPSGKVWTDEERKEDEEHKREVLSEVIRFVRVSIGIGGCSISDNCPFFSQASSC
ncbi:hypothetical protein ABKN59_003334 [Abortiporus biennis]